MYHHVNSDKYSNDFETLDSHFEYISEHFISLFPTTNPLAKNSICLVFDDGYYDFYRFTYPLLKKHKLKAILAVVPSAVLENSSEDDSVRLGIKHDSLFDEYKKGTFCTYEELREMSESGFVQIASHSYNHKDLTSSDIDLYEELKKSKERLEQKLDCKIESFVFPFGKYNQKVLDETKKYYKYAFRIGNGINKDFSGIGGVIYRVNGDSLASKASIFSFKNMLKYRLKSLRKKALS